MTDNEINKESECYKANLSIIKALHLVGEAKGETRGKLAEKFAELLREYSKGDINDTDLCRLIGEIEEGVYTND